MNGIFHIWRLSPNTHDICSQKHSCCKPSAELIDRQAKEEHAELQHPTDWATHAARRLPPSQTPFWQSSSPMWTGFGSHCVMTLPSLPSHPSLSARTHTNTHEEQQTTQPTYWSSLCCSLPLFIFQCPIFLCGKNRSVLNSPGKEEGHCEVMLSWFPSMIPLHWPWTEGMVSQKWGCREHYKLSCCINSLSLVGHHVIFSMALGQPTEQQSQWGHLFE